MTKEEKYLQLFEETLESCLKEISELAETFFKTDKNENIEAQEKFKNHYLLNVYFLILNIAMYNDDVNPEERQIIEEMQNRINLFSILEVTTEKETPVDLSGFISGPHKLFLEYIENRMKPIIFSFYYHVAFTEVTTRKDESSHDLFLKIIDGIKKLCILFMLVDEEDKEEREYIIDLVVRTQFDIYNQSYKTAVTYYG